jgi:tripartite-type tricarboxylate transporter receptor subunit TctC
MPTTAAQPAFTFAIVLAALANNAAAAAAAQPYPARPIRIIVASAPSSGPDVVARLVARQLSEAWGQQVIVDDRAGAGGNLGAEIAAHAAPDGYTLLMATASQAIAVSLYPKLGYDLVKDFAPVSLLASTPYILAVNPSVPANSVKELIAAAKAKPDTINYGSGGSGSPPHLSAEIFKSMAGIRIVHVPYKGITPALTDLMAGQIQMAFAVVPAVLPHVKSNKLRALGVSGLKRTRLAPELPTIAETVPGYEVIGWYGLLAPTGAPAAIIAKVQSEAAKAVKSQEVQEKLGGLGADAIGTTPQQFTTFIKSEIQKMGKAVRESGARAD